MGEMETPKASVKQVHGTGKDRFDSRPGSGGGLPSTLNDQTGSRMWEQGEDLRLPTAVASRVTRDYLNETNAT